MRHVPDVTTMVTLLQESANQVAGTVPCPNSVYLLIFFNLNLQFLQLLLCRYQQQSDFWGIPA